MKEIGHLFIETSKTHMIGVIAAMMNYFHESEILSVCSPSFQAAYEAFSHALESERRLIPPLESFFYD